MSQDTDTRFICTRCGFPREQHLLANFFGSPIQWQKVRICPTAVYQNGEETRVAEAPALSGGVADQVLFHLWIRHPLPWTIYQDWAVEVHDAGGRIVAKFSSRDDAETFIKWGKKYRRYMDKVANDCDSCDAAYDRMREVATKVRAHLTNPPEGDSGLEGVLEELDSVVSDPCGTAENLQGRASITDDDGKVVEPASEAIWRQTERLEEVRAPLRGDPDE